MFGMHSLLSHVKKPGAHVFDSCGHVLLFCGSIKPGHKHSPFTCDIVMPSGQRQVCWLFGAPTQMYEHFDCEHELLPYWMAWPKTLISMSDVMFSAKAWTIIPESKMQNENPWIQHAVWVGIELVSELGKTTEFWSSVVFVLVIFLHLISECLIRHLVTMSVRTFVSRENSVDLPIVPVH